MSTQQVIHDLSGRTIASATIQARVNGDAELLIQFTDGSLATVAAWKQAEHPLEMNVDVSPNHHASANGGASPRRGM